MKSESKLDEVYSKSYDEIYDELSIKVMTTLRQPTKNTLLFKRDVLINELNDVFKAMTWKQISPGGYMPDQYTERLLSDFKFHIDDYLEDKITNFIDDHLEKIKEVFKDVELSIPSNIKLNARETVEFIAKHNALQKFIQKVYSIDKNDTIEICEKKISKDGYTPPSNQVADIPIGNDGEENLDDETKITTKQQVLILKYMMDFLNVSMVDHSVKAKFIKKLTGKSYDNIYKAIREPTKYDSVKRFKQDMRYVKSEFESLGLQGIVNKIIEDTDKNQ
jgi:hypothetical protein